MSEDLLSREEGPVHRLTLNRPARRNALTPDLASEIAGELGLIEERGAARVVVLGGAGGHFCAGLDLHWLRSLGAMPSMAELQRGLSDFQSAVLAIVRCPLPVVAVIQGTVAGFGLDLALACDLRLAEAGATFTSAFARMGLVPDGGSTFTLPRLAGAGPRAALPAWPARRSTPRARSPSAWWTKCRGRAEFDAAVAAVTKSIAGRGGLERARDQAPGPRGRAGRAGAGARRRGGGADSGAAGPRVPPQARSVRLRDEPAPAPIFRPDLLAGQVALVTGGGTGIGFGIASCLARAGATVAIASRKPEHLEAAADRAPRGGAKVTTVETNVREPEAVAPDGGAGRRRARSARHPGEQRGRQLLRALGDAFAQRLAGGGGDRSLRHLLLLPGGATRS